MNQGQEEGSRVCGGVHGHPLRKRNSGHRLEVDGNRRGAAKDQWTDRLPASRLYGMGGVTGANPPDDAAHIYYFVTGSSAIPTSNCAGGAIRRPLKTTSRTHGRRRLHRYLAGRSPLGSGQTVEIRKSDQDIHMLEFPDAFHRPPWRTRLSPPSTERSPAHPWQPNRDQTNLSLRGRRCVDAGPAGRQRGGLAEIDSPRTSRSARIYHHHADVPGVLPLRQTDAPRDSANEILEKMKTIEASMGKGFGDVKNPLLVSVSLPDT